MFELEDLRNTRVWQEAYKEGLVEEGRKEGREVAWKEVRQKLACKLLAEGMGIKNSAKILEMSPQAVRRLVKSAEKRAPQ